MVRVRWAMVLAVVAALGHGCSSPPYVPDSLLYPRMFFSSDSSLEYRLPVGWLDVTADSQANGAIIWLVRSDYAASMTVSEIHLDATARKVMREGGLTQVASLTMQMVTKETPGVVAQEPLVCQVNGATCCSYELRIPSHDFLRTILLDTGSRLYAVTVLKPSRSTVGPEIEVRDVQQAFLRTLRW